MVANNDDPAYQSAAYGEMMRHWELPVALLGGTLEMRAGKTKWLPDKPGERPEEYRARLNSSVLFEAFSDIVARLTNLPFSRNVKLTEELVPRLDGFVENVDGTGEDLTSFARAFFNNAIAFGKAHFLVDFPDLRPSERNPNPQFDSVLRGRPFWRQIHPTNLIGWRSEFRDGTEVLTQIRYRDDTHIEDGGFGEVFAERIRVWTETDWQLWQRLEAGTQGGGGDFKLIDSGTHSFGEIPLITVYFHRTGFMRSLPTVERVAWLNLHHYQSASEQTNILSVGRVPIITEIGVSKKEAERDIEVGSGRRLSYTNPDVKVDYLEVSGPALEAGFQDLNHTEEMMERFGMAPVQRRSGHIVATARAIDEARHLTDVQAWVRATEIALREGLEFTYRWIKETLPEELFVDIYSEFSVMLRADEDMARIEEHFRMGLVRGETVLAEAKRRNLYGATLDPETEVELAADEAATRDPLLPDNVSNGESTDGNVDGDGESSAELLVRAGPGN